MFRNRGFIFRKTVVYTFMVQCVLHASVKEVHTCIYNRLPEDEPSGSEHVEDIKIKN